MHHEAETPPQVAVDEAIATVEGAQYHDAPIGSQWHGEVVMDELDALVH